MMGGLLSMSTFWGKIVVQDTNGRSSILDKPQAAGEPRRREGRMTR